MSRNIVARFLILITLVIYLGAVALVGQAERNMMCNPPPGGCLWLYHWDETLCMCVCDCPDPQTGECPNSCN